MKRTGNEIHLFSHQRTVRYIPSLTELSWPGPGRGQTARHINSPTELSWPGPQGDQTVRFIHPSTELSWPGQQRGQTVSYPTELSWPGPQGGQTVRFIHFPTELLDQPTNQSVDRPTDWPIDWPIDRATNWLPLIILFYVDNIIQAKSCLQMVQGGGENVVVGQIARSKMKLTNHRSTKHIPFYATMWIPRCSFAVSRRRPFPERKRSTVIQHRYTLTYE